jgi:hypothetical protein
MGKDSLWAEVLLGMVAAAVDAVKAGGLVEAVEAAGPVESVAVVEM